MGNTRSPKTSVPEVAVPKVYPLIDHEYKRILNAIDTLYKECYNHWETELAIYDMGLERLKMLKKNNIDHVRTIEPWKQHNTEHKKLLKSIQDLRKGIVKDEMDVPHFKQNPRSSKTYVPEVAVPEVSPLIDHEHKRILNAIDMLYKECYDMGPKHRKVLESIQKLREGIVKHIHEMDVPHFQHWSGNIGAAELTSPKI